MEINIVDLNAVRFDCDRCGANGVPITIQDLLAKDFCVLLEPSLPKCEHCRLIEAMRVGARPWSELGVFLRFFAETRTRVEAQEFGLPLQINLLS